MGPLKSYFFFYLLFNEAAMASWHHAHDYSWVFIVPWCQAYGLLKNVQDGFSRKTRNSKNKSGYSIVGHPVIGNWPSFFKARFSILIIFPLRKFFTKIFLDILFTLILLGQKFDSIYSILLTPNFLWTLKICQPKIFFSQFFSPPNSYGHVHYQDNCDTRTSFWPPYTS